MMKHNEFSCNCGCHFDKKYPNDWHTTYCAQLAKRQARAEVTDLVAKDKEPK